MFVNTYEHNITMIHFMICFLNCAECSYLVCEHIKGKTDINDNGFIIQRKIERRLIII